MRRTWLMLALVPLMVCGAKKGKKGKEPAASAGPPAATFPVADSPYEDQVLWPPMSGSTESLDITAMTRSKTWYTFEVDAAYLADVDEEGARLVMRTLAALPGWRVHEGPTGVVASLRDGDGFVSRSGYHIEGRTAWAASVRATPMTASSTWRTVSQVGRASPSDSSVKLLGMPISTGPFQGAWTSAFRVEGPVMSFGIHELGDEDDRARSARALGAVGRTLDLAASMTDMVATDGVRGMYLPAGEPGTAPSLEIRSPREGWLEVRARVSPPSWGWTWIRLVVDGKPWEEGPVGSGTRERVGGGVEGSYFYLQGEFPVASGPAAAAEAEVWFTSASSEAPMKLTSFPVSIPAR